MTVDKETMAALLERVRTATGPDRELEIALVEAFDGPGEAVLHEVHHIRAYEYLSSIDAALALTERVLPGEWPGILRYAMSDLSKRFGWHVTFPKPEHLSLLPLSIVSATLAALIAQAETP